LFLEIPMRHLIAALLCVLLVGQASAGCRSNDRWRGDDKQLHVLGAGAISFVATLHTRDPWQGFWWGTGAAVAKEAIDAAGMGDCSMQDLAVGVIAAGVAAYTGGLIVTRVQGRTLVAYTTTF
jgi:hypothetical protein